MLDWYITKADAGYSLPLPPLSAEEEGVVEAVSEEFREISKHKSSEGDRASAIRELLSMYCKRSNIHLEKDQERYLAEYINANIFGFCGIEHILQDDAVEEIGIIGIGRPVYVYRSGKGWEATNLFFRTEEGAVDLINKMARALGRRVTYQNPRLNAVLPDGSRLHASIPPISGVEMTIRKFRVAPISVGDLINFKTYSADALAFLSVVFQSDFNIIIAGNTASGKTSTLNALFSFVPLNERILIIEETPEINIPHPHRMKMLSNVELGIDMQSLVQDSLRMRPDRVIVGEVRTPEEVRALIETILSGQARGSYATFHAQSAEEVMKRLISLGILQMDLSAIDFIVVQRRIARYDRETKAHWEERKGIEIIEVSGEKPDLITLFAYDPATDIMHSSIDRSQKLDEIASSFSLSRNELIEEIRRRAGAFSAMAKGNIQFEQSVQRLQKDLFGLELTPSRQAEGEQGRPGTTATAERPKRKKKREPAQGEEASGQPSS